MLSKVTSFALNGLEGVPVEVETDINKGMVSYDIVGLPDAAVKESRERVRSAIKNSAMRFPVNKITINLAPADIKKEGSHYDLPLAISILKASDQLSANTDGIVFLGELALDGALRPVTGILPVLISAKDKGYTRFIVPKANANEASYIEGTQVYALNSLREVVDLLSGEAQFEKVPHRSFVATQSAQKYNYDLSLVKGQKVAKRALEIAVAGGHNILLAGPPGTGKTLLARCIPTIMPDMTFEESLEVTKIHSISGELSEDGIVSLRPFRTPHHTATTVSLCGGGSGKIYAGEISKAHKGVLFLDELPEYTRHTLESLRQPLEDRVITVTRAGGAVTFPADFILCASMNPCPCGNYGSAYLECTCTPSQIHKYRSKVSGPLLDRIDLQVEVDGVKYDDLASDGAEESSAQVKARVERARKVQRERFADDSVSVNANMGERQLKKYCRLSAECEDILRSAFEMLHLSARARARIIKVARTIADLDGSANIKPEHILEAASYRSYDKGV
ncbi:MAG: YifB family Mg chelatase-like AAA ATPase [Clostridia bacterium]|nr:YifB family Mg chelatase-like AAA ATPase [Clostridia bacterium]